MLIERTTMSKERILVIDGEKNIRDSIKKTLTSDYEVTLAVNGEEGIEIFKDEKNNLVLLGMELPGMGGNETLAKIKEIEPNASVVMMTGSESVDNAVETMKLGAVDYLRKPFNTNEIEEVVQNVIKRKNTELEEENLNSYGEIVEYAKKGIKKRQFAKAREYLQKAVGMDTTKPEAFNLLGIILEMQDEVLEAQKQYRAALALDSTYKPAQDNLDRTTESDYSKDNINMGDEK